MISAFKPPTDKRFPRTARLLTSKDFNAVFERRKTTRSRNFSLHQLPVGQANPTETLSEPAALPAESGPRLGVVVPKKLLRRAIHRNLIKRLAREAFRHLAADLQKRDLIIRLHGKIDPDRIRIDRQVLAAEIMNLLKTQVPAQPRSDPT